MIDFETTAGGVSDGSLYTASTVSENTWTHIAFTWDGHLVKAYINGVLDSATDRTTGNLLANAGTDGWIGLSGNSHWLGKIDDTRFYNRALNSNEIEFLASNLESGLLAHYTFDDHLGDSSGNDHHVVSVHSSPTYESGKLGQSMEFDGADDRLLVPDDDVFDTNTFSFASWIYLDTVDGYRNIISKVGSAASFELRMEDNNLQLGFTAVIEVRLARGI